MRGMDNIKQMEYNGWPWKDAFDRLEYGLLQKTYARLQNPSHQIIWTAQDIEIPINVVRESALELISNELKKLPTEYVLTRTPRYGCTGLLIHHGQRIFASIAFLDTIELMFIGSPDRSGRGRRIIEYIYDYADPEFDSNIVYLLLEHIKWGIS